MGVAGEREDGRVGGSAGRGRGRAGGWVWLVKEQAGRRADVWLDYWTGERKEGRVGRGEGQQGERLVGGD